jgi:hypothetical protein
MYLHTVVDLKLSVHICRRHVIRRHQIKQTNFPVSFNRPKRFKTFHLKVLQMLFTDGR